MTFPITKIIVYKNGFAYFEREGTVVGEQQVSLEFKPTEVNDVLRSLRVADEHGGVITNVTYETTKQLITKGRAPLFIPASNSMTTIFNHLQGVNVKLDRGEESTTGRVIGLTKKTGISVTEQAYLEIDLLMDKTITSWRVDSIGSITILDDELPNDMNAFLDYVVASKDKETRKVNIVCSGSGKRRVTISYILQNPVWKSSYRIHMKQNVDEKNNKESEVQIEGWACVDNISDEDWSNVSLSLASGTSISYSYDLYNPILCSHNEQYSYSANHQMRQFQVNYKPSHIMYDSNTATAVPAGFEGNDNIGFIPPPPAAAGGFGAQNVTKNNDNNNNNNKKYGDDSIKLNDFVANSQFQYNIPGKFDKHRVPLAGVLFKNMMGNTLDKGPIFVSENNKYVGEAYLQNNVAEHEWRILPYSTLPECSVITSAPSQVWIPLKLEINNGRLTGTQRLQESIEYSIKNNSGEELEFVLEHSIPSGWDFAEKLATLEVKVSDSTRRFFFKVPPYKREKFIVKYNRESRYADVWLINMNSQTLEQLESLLTTEIGNKFVSFFESAKTIYGHRSTYVELKQEEDAILAEQYRLHTLAQHANQHTRTSFSERLMECEDRLTRIREARNAAIDKWKTARSSLLESIDALKATVDLYNKKDQKFKVPPLLPTMTIRELVAEPPDVPIQDSIFTSYGGKNGNARFGGPESTAPPPFGTRRVDRDNTLDFTGANSAATTGFSSGNRTPSTGTGFGTTAAPTSGFGTTAAPTSGFGATTPSTGTGTGFGTTAAPTSVFGATTSSTGTGFGTTAAPTSGFGVTTPSLSIPPFGSSTTTTPSTSLFTAPATTTSSAFGSAAPTTPSLFTAPAAPTSSPFGSTAPAATTSSVFGSRVPAATSSFGSTTAATTSSPFASTTPAATTASALPAISAPTPSFSFGSTSSPAPPDSSSNITWSNSPRD